MQKLYAPVRLGLLLLAMATALTVYVSALYRIQVYDARPSEDELYPRTLITRNVTLPAARGNIYDRNGVLLSSGRPSHNITLNRDELIRRPDFNDIVLELIYAAADAGIRHNDSLPITQGPPFNFISNMSASQRRRLDAYIEFYRLDPDISASDLLVWMRRSNNYNIDYTVGIMDARLISGVRYELEIRAIMGNIAPYVFAYDVSADFVSLIKERGLIGVHVESSFVRQYHTSYAGHLIGYIAPISPNDAEFFRELGYPMDALVGRMGAELAFEHYLRGVDGLQVITMTDTGAVYNVRTRREPEPGRHVYLTIDLDLQMAAEHALRNHIEMTNLTREPGDQIPGGAVVVTNVRTGEVLASASNPTFDQMTVSNSVTRAALYNDNTRPMFNRAAQGRYSPGSTFKMATAYAVLREGVVGRWTPINCTGRYLAWEHVGLSPACWIHALPGAGRHGPLDIVQALEHSCNVFFMHAADHIDGQRALSGERALAEAATAFGLGRRTGIEIPEVSGILATLEFIQGVPTLGNYWSNGDTVMTAFGQGHSMFTPIQLANYTATIANGGTLNQLSILSRVRSSDLSEILHTHTPTVMNQIEETEYIRILQEGMIGAAANRHGTAHSVFGNYPIRVAAKTGTAQLEGQAINNGVFVAYAPANNPEIAISIVIEKGGSGSAVMPIAREIFDFYFRAERTFNAVPYGALIP